MSSEKPINVTIETVFFDKSVLNAKRIHVFLVVNVILLAVNFTQSVDTKGSNRIRFSKSLAQNGIGNNRLKTVSRRGTLFHCVETLN